MAIILELDKIMKEKEISIVELSSKIGIAPNNLSVIKNGKASAIRFSTLDAICNELGCQPGDIIKHELREQEKKSVVPMFLDYSGTTDLLLSGGAENVKNFFNSIIAMQNKLDSEVQITMVTGSSFESAKAKFKLLSELAENYNLPNLFDSAIAEYCGFAIKKDSFEKLLTLHPNILDKRSEIESIVQNYGGEISTAVTSMYNVVFENISRIDLANVSEEIDKIMEKATGDKSIETVTYYDDYGKECDIKPVNHTKYNAVLMIMKQLQKKYNIPFAIIGGDSQDEDLKMYTQNKKELQDMGITTVFIAPSNIGEMASGDKNIIVSDWENSDGIAEAVRIVTSRVQVNEDGEIEL